MKRISVTSLKGWPCASPFKPIHEDKFTGTVRQIRLNPTEEQNVVNYIVIVNTQNESGTLFPGMTATADFTVEEREGVPRSNHAPPH